MNEQEIERMLESTDLSTRSKIRHSLRRDLLDGSARRAPRSAWAFNALAFAVMAVGAVVFVALVLGRGSGGGIPAAQTEPESTLMLDPYAHTVQEGETLSSIVALYGWDDSIIPEVLTRNGLTPESQIVVGQVLLIPSHNGPCPIDAGLVAIMIPAGSPYAQGYSTAPAPCPPNTYFMDRETALVIKAAMENGLPLPTPTLVPYHHMVSEGETLLSIVQIYGWEDASIIPTVLQMNGLTSEDQIVVGMMLMIPPRVEYPPFAPCPPGTVILIPPTMVVGEDVPSSETATAFPTIPPCDPGTAIYDGGSGVFGPNSAMTATPIPFDPNATEMPTVPPPGFMLPTPTPANPPGTMTPMPTLDLNGFVVMELDAAVSEALGYRNNQRAGSQGYVTTSYRRTVGTTTRYMVLHQSVPADDLSLPVRVFELVFEPSQAETIMIHDLPGLWFEGWESLPGLWRLGSDYVDSSMGTHTANVLIWNQEGYTFFLIADDLTQEEMIELAESLQ